MGYGPRPRRFPMLLVMVRLTFAGFLLFPDFVDLAAKYSIATICCIRLTDSVLLSVIKFIRGYRDSDNKKVHSK